MSHIVKTIVATGASSGLGFEAVKQLLRQAQPYKLIIGARDTKRTQAAYDDLQFDAGKHSISILPLNLSNLRDVKSFAQQTLKSLGSEKLDLLFLNAAVSRASDHPGPHGSKWCEPYVVNHLSQHYLTHLLHEKLAASRSRIVVVSSGAVRNVTDDGLKTLKADLSANSGANGMVVYCSSKFVQLVGAHYWRQKLKDTCEVVAVSPGLIPDTGLNRSYQLPAMQHPDAKSVEEGARSLLAAFTRDDIPEDPEQIFLTSWGEWWPKDVYEKSLDKRLQDEWCSSQADIEKHEIAVA